MKTERRRRRRSDPIETDGKRYGEREREGRDRRGEGGENRGLLFWIGSEEIEKRFASLARGGDDDDSPLFFL